MQEGWLLCNTENRKKLQEKTRLPGKTRVYSGEIKKLEVNSVKKKKQKKTAQRQIKCPVCGAMAVLRPAAEIYRDPYRSDQLYVCSNYPKCRCYVGTHPGTNIPLGTLADGDLRNLRIQAHRKFDSVWRSRIMSRESAYCWMADLFGIPLREAHIGLFGEYRCRELIRACDQVLENCGKMKGVKSHENDGVSETAC